RDGGAGARPAAPRSDRRVCARPRGDAVVGPDLRSRLRRVRGGVAPMTVGDVFRDMARRPARCLVARWNWKAAVLSAGLRSPIFFATNLTFGWDAAVRALIVDAVFRTPLVGVYGAATQAFSRAEPARVAS